MIAEFTIYLEQNYCIGSIQPFQIVQTHAFIYQGIIEESIYTTLQPHTKKKQQIARVITAATKLKLNFCVLLIPLPRRMGILQGGCGRVLPPHARHGHGKVFHPHRNLQSGEWLVVKMFA